MRVPVTVRYFAWLRERVGEPSETVETRGAATVGELRASGHVLTTVRAEIRDNLLSALRAGRDPWPGIHGSAASTSSSSPSS